MYLIKVGIVKKAYLRKSPTDGDDGRLKKKKARGKETSTRTPAVTLDTVRDGTQFGMQDGIGCQSCPKPDNEPTPRAPRPATPPPRPLSSGQ